MRRRISRGTLSFLVFFAVILGASFAGSSGCPPCCSDGGVIPACCTETDENSMFDFGGMTGHSPQTNGCSHDGICLDGSQPVDISTAGRMCVFDSALVQSYFSSEAYLDPCYRASYQAILGSPRENFPPLYLRNCSFLI